MTTLIVPARQAHAALVRTCVSSCRVTNASSKAVPHCLRERRVHSRDVLIRYLKLAVHLTAHATSCRVNSAKSKAVHHRDRERRVKTTILNVVEIMSRAVLVRISARSCRERNVSAKVVRHCRRERLVHQANASSRFSKHAAERMAHVPCYQGMCVSFRMVFRKGQAPYAKTLTAPNRRKPVASRQVSAKTFRLSCASSAAEDQVARTVHWSSVRLFRLRRVVSA